MVIPTEYEHKGIHKIESGYNCIAYNCEFAVEKFTDGYEEHVVENTATVKYTGQGYTVTGRDSKVVGLIVGVDPNTNVLYLNTSIPVMSYRVERGTAAQIEMETETFYEQSFIQGLTGKEQMGIDPTYSLLHRREVLHDIKTLRHGYVFHAREVWPLK